METDVVERAARIVEFFVGENEFAESEIADFDIEEGVFAENVFGLRVRSDCRAHLDVAMDDSHAVQIAEAVGERIDDAEGFFFGENRAAADPIEEFAALQKLHYDVNRLSITDFSVFFYLFRFERIDQLHDVLVVHQRQNRDLRLDQTRLFLHETPPSIEPP